MSDRCSSWMRSNQSFSGIAAAWFRSAILSPLIRVVVWFTAIFSDSPIRRKDSISISRDGAFTRSCWTSIIRHATCCMRATLPSISRLGCGRSPRNYIRAASLRCGRTTRRTRNSCRHSAASSKTCGRMKLRSRIHCSSRNLPVRFTSRAGRIDSARARPRAVSPDWAAAR